VLRAPNEMLGRILSSGQPLRIEDEQYVEIRRVTDVVAAELADRDDDEASRIVLHLERDRAGDDFVREPGEHAGRLARSDTPGQIRYCDLHHYSAARAAQSAHEPVATVIGIRFVDLLLRERLELRGDRAERIRHGDRRRKQSVGQIGTGGERLTHELTGAKHRGPDVRHARVLRQHADVRRRADEVSEEGPQVTRRLLGIR
jgi:hypothetical protein